MRGSSALGLLSLSLVSLSSFAADPSQVQVQGLCSTKVISDMASITFTAENQSRDQKDAAAKTNNQINSLKEKIKGMKLAELNLRNTNYQVFPVREYEKDKLVDKGTKVSLSLEVTTSDIAKLGDTLELATKEGISNVGSLQTFLSPKKNQAEYSKCLDIASEDALSKARQLAKKFGASVGEVHSIKESPVQSSTPTPMFAERAMMKSSDSTSIETGERDFTTSIEVTFLLK